MRWRDSWVLAVLLIISAAVFLPGINWGLPSEAVNPFLFGSHAQWNGQEILRLAGPTEDPNRGADVASYSSVDRQYRVVVNATDADRARIIRRYRLMSYQPDEWNTLKALSEMKPAQGNFDPKLYQYGGLWIYPVGAMLKAASMLHLIELRSDMAWYLDHPAAFGRFYIVARLWSVTWAMIGVIAIFVLVRRIVGGSIFPALASLSYIFMPVVVNMAHEAKPHLAGAVLTLLSVLAGSWYVERGRRRDWILTGALCGAALGMVLSTLTVFLIVPAMVLLRSSPWREKIVVCGSAIAVGLLVYAVTNPYVPVNFVRNRAVLESNFDNSKAMYHARFTRAGLANTCYLMAAGVSPLLAIAGAAGTLALGMRAVRTRRSREPAEIARRSTGLLLAIPAFCVMGQCVVLATGKPGEFGRFMLLADVFLAVEAIVAIATFWPMAFVGSAPRTTIFAAAETVRGADPTRIMQGHFICLVLVLTTAIPGFSYIRAFVNDSRMSTSRLVEAARLQQLQSAGVRTIAVYADPAPYCLPPVDLFRTRILLMARGADSANALMVGGISVQAVDSMEETTGLKALLRLYSDTPISWADKPFIVREGNQSP